MSPVDENKLYKAKLILNTDEEIDLAWNIHRVDVVDDYVTLDHARGRVIHRLAPGETISFLEQLNQGSGDERSGS